MSLTERIVTEAKYKHATCETCLEQAVNKTLDEAIRTVRLLRLPMEGDPKEAILRALLALKAPERSEAVSNDDARARNI